MKSYRIYRDIRKRALIFGLPVSMFALQMIGVIGSLLVVIFSFSLSLVFGAVLSNGILYILLLKLVNRPDLLHIAEVFPKAISNKKTTPINYAD